MTEYVILRAQNDSGTIFAIAGEEVAGSPQAAIRKWAAADRKEEEAEGEAVQPASIYAAVPKRSWSVAEIETRVVTTTRVKAL